MFDTIIVGRDLSSLIAAMVSSRNGHKALLVTEGDQEMEHRDAGYVFPVDPMPLSGLREEQTFGRLRRELRLEPDETPEALLMDPALQIALPAHRIDLFCEREKLIADMIREFPRQEREIRCFYRAVGKAAASIERLIDKGRDRQRHGCRAILPGLFHFLPRRELAVSSRL